jgi:hypothetical protein
VGGTRHPQGEVADQLTGVRALDPDQQAVALALDRPPRPATGEPLVDLGAAHRLKRDVARELGQRAVGVQRRGVARLDRAQHEPLGAQRLREVEPQREAGRVAHAPNRSDSSPTVGER